jgi:hypothetical protein
MTAIDPLQILREKREALGTKAVAEALGYSESSIRVAATGKWAGSTAKLHAKVLAVYAAAVHCPHVDRQIPMAECQNRARSPRPFGGQARERWWQACQSCPARLSGHEA